MRVTKYSSGFAALGFGLLLFTDLASAQDVSQMKVGTLTANTSASTANSQFPTSLTSTREIWGPDPMVNRPVELKELARALRNNPDLIYEYVHDNVKTVFMYGLQKGALGAMIDQSGTPFDQAHLMVELLRESGFSARYKAGTLRLTTDQMNAWMGTNNTSAIQKILRDGGIPVGFSSPNFTIGHVWVEVTIPNSSCNSTCWFDPSYKVSTHKSPVTGLAALMGIGNETTEFAASTSGTGFFATSWTGLGQQSSAADPVWVSNINNNNLQSRLQTYSTNLLGNLKSATHSAKEIDDVIGGQDILKTGAGPIRNNGVLAGFIGATTVQRSWDCTGSTTCGIPNPYRTKVTFSMVDHVTGTVAMTKALYVDEFYGRRVMFDTGVFGGTGLENWCVSLSVDGNAIAGTNVGCVPNPPTGYRPPPGRLYLVRFEVDHPYAGGATALSYMDRTAAAGTQVEKLADFLLPVPVAYGFGDVSPALVSKLSAEVREDRLTRSFVPPGAEPFVAFVESAMDHTMTKLGLSYAAQYSRVAEIAKRLGSSEHHLHHMLGVVYGETDVRNGYPLEDRPHTTNDWYIRDRGIRINVDGAISVNSKNNDTAERRKVLHSTIAAAGTLEGSVFEQMLDNPFVGSTARRFAWGRSNVANLRYYLYRPTSPAPSGGFGADFGTAGCAPAANYTSLLPHYVNATKGFWAITPAEKCLGPGNKYGHKFGSDTQIPGTERGPAFIAYLPDLSGVAHVVGYTEPLSGGGRLFKGGGAAVAPEYAKEFDAEGAASLLADKYEDKNGLHGIDLLSGDYNFAAPADISIGEGGFPYQLSFERAYKSTASKSPGLANGWAHNLDVRIAMSGDGLAKMGTDSAQAAAETIAAIYVAQKIYEVVPTLNSSTTATNLQNHLKRWVLAPFVMDWWGQKLTYNVVTINAGHSARQFTKFADGNFYPPRNGVGTLTKPVGAERTLALADTQDAPEPIYDRWSYAPITSFTYTSPQRDTQHFGYYEYQNDFDPYGTLPSAASGRKHGWHLTNWTFPYGVSLTYSYNSAAIGLGPVVDRLTSVSNNLGRALTLNYVGSQDTGSVVLDSVIDGKGRVVTFTQPGFSEEFRLLTAVTSPENANGPEVINYHYIGAGQNSASVPAGARPQPYPKLWKVFAPSDPNSAKLQVDYDRTWRAKEYRDAIAILTPAQRAPWKFYITGTNRGERADPLDAPGDQRLHTAYFDPRGRAVQIVDEESRVVSQWFDNKDRVREREYPEGNRDRFVYDDVTQQIKQVTKIPKSATFYSDTMQNLELSATYDPVCGKLKTIVDARGKTTTWNYNSSGAAPACTLANVQQPQVQNPEAANTLATPTTSFVYNSFGQLTQVTDPTGRIVSIEYDPATRYRWRRHVDPNGFDLITEYGHNAYGDVSSVKDPRLNLVSYTYDKMRRLTLATGPLGSVTKNILDVDGDVREVWRATNGDATTWQKWLQTFTPTKNVYQQTSPTGAVISTFYDALDRVDYVQDADGRKVKTDYFKDGVKKRTIKAYQSASISPIVYESFTLTPNGQVDTATDANGNVTNLDYDGLDRLVRTFLPDPATGMPCAPSLPHSSASPSCGSNQTYEELAYDASGNVISRRNRGGSTIVFAFDDLNREITRTVPANSMGRFGRILTTSYDLAGRAWDLSADSQTISNRYDGASRLDYVVDNWIGATNNTIDYGYDAGGNRTSLTWPGGGSLTYSYDALNRIDTIVDSGGVQLADYDWDYLSRKDLMRSNNASVSTDYGYEADDDLNLITHSAPMNLSWSIGRNNGGQITSLGVNEAALLSRPAVTKTDTFVPNHLNQIATLNDDDLGYDINGNLISDGVFTFEYDEENRLRSAVGNGKTISYEYDPLGRRRAKVVDGVITKYVSDAAEEIEERDGSNNVLRRYAYGAGLDERVAMYDNAACASRCFYQTNWQGSTIKLLNQSNVVIETYQYGPYGETTGWNPVAPITGNPFRYTGRRLDPETGLYYYRARYYSTKLGRFLQTDPIGISGDMNLYAYASGDPTNRTDPSGLKDYDCTGGAGTGNCDGSAQLHDGDTIKVGDTTYSISVVTHNSVSFTKVTPTSCGAVSTLEYSVLGRSFVSVPQESHSSQGALADGISGAAGKTALASGVLEAAAHPNLRAGTNGKFYWLWNGNQYVKTYNPGKFFKRLGAVATGVGSVADYRRYKQGRLGGGEFLVNTGMAVIGLIPTGVTQGIAIGYFGGKMFEEEKISGNGAGMNLWGPTVGDFAVR